MELKQIKELMAAMSRYGTKRLEYRKDGLELVLERECSEAAMVPPATAFYSPSVSFPAGQPTQERIHTAFSQGGGLAALSPGMEEKRQREEGEKYIESPMVGTFYSSPSPEAPPFIRVGDRVEKDTVVAIIEAMKVMNEVKARVSGVIVESFLSNGDPVEVGTPLFRITE